MDTYPHDRYVVISADCHAGADLRDYRPFLEAAYHDEFDRWADAYVNPFGDLVRVAVRDACDREGLASR